MALWLTSEPRPRLKASEAGARRPFFGHSRGAQTKGSLERLSCLAMLFPFNGSTNSWVAPPFATLASEAGGCHVWSLKVRTGHKSEMHLWLKNMSPRVSRPHSLAFDTINFQQAQNAARMICAALNSNRPGKQAANMPMCNVCISLEKGVVCHIQERVSRITMP